MERPSGKIEQPQDEYDYEVTQVEADAIALADELLKRKPEGSPWTFVDIVLEGDRSKLMAEIQESPFADLLAAPDEQLAIESDGSYYPVLDVRKEKGRLVGVGLRAWGWNNDKIRWTKPREAGPPYEYKEYPGQKDEMRQLEIAMSYQVGRETVTEDLSLYFGTTSGTIRASSQLHMMVYAETGYEGHGGKGRSGVSEEDAYWFLDFIARHVGERPKSVAELLDERLATIRVNAERYGVLKSIDKLIKDTWNAQALYLMNLPCRLLEGNMSIAEGLESADTAARAGEAARLLGRQYKAKRMDSSAGGEWIVTEDDEDEDD